MSEILVGIDDTPGADDALAFAASIARATGGSLRLISAYQDDDPRTRASSEALRDYLEDDASGVLAAAAASVEGIDVATEAIADVSPPHALHAAAERCGAPLVVVGSTHHGRIGRVLPGSTGERLLHGSSCAVAIVPRGYAKQFGQIAAVATGYDGSDESSAALATACRLARRLGAALRVIHVFDASRVGQPALMTGPAWLAMRDEHETVQRMELERAVAALPDDITVETRFVVGTTPAEELARHSRDADLIVVGSRGHGPFAAVLLGGVTHSLLRRAACPVIVLPRAVEAGLESMFASAAEAVA
jgi:nucleotide-binding universal stress UspA family protein